MEIGGISSALPSSSSKEGIETTKEQFLQLLLAQLEHQDPLQPPDANKFTEQMTQFGQLEQLFNVNESIQALQAQQSLTERAQATSLLNNNVQAINSQLEITLPAPAEVGFQLTQGPGNVTVEVVDTLGRIVRTVEYSDQPLGASFVEFDGKNDDGGDLPNGVYHIQVSARSSTGAKLAANPLIRGAVSGVEFIDGNAVVKLGAKSIAMNDIISVTTT